MLELELVVFGQLLCAGEVGWLTFLFKLNFFAERIAQPTLDQIDREISDINPDPLTAKFLRGVNSRAASAKQIEHDIAGIRGGGDNPLHECERLLCGVPETLLSLRTDRADIIPEVLKLNSWMLVSVIFQPKAPAGFRRKVQATFGI